MGGDVGFILSASWTASKSDCNAWKDRRRVSDARIPKRPGKNRLAHLGRRDQQTPPLAVLAHRRVFRPPVLPLGPRAENRKDVKPTPFEIHMELVCHLIHETWRHYEQGGKVRDVSGRRIPFPPS
jgi:hypothetical protein